MARFDPRLVQYNASTDAAVLHAAGRTGARRRRASRARRSRRTRRSGSDGFDRRRLRAGRIPDAARSRELHLVDGHVDEGYFATMGIPIVRGRGFLASDTADAPRVAVVNEQFAKHYWPGADAVGKHIRLDSRDRHAGRDRRRRADHQVSGDRREADGFRVPAAGAASGRANGPAAAVERRSAAAGRAGEGRRPDARCEPADAGDADLRGSIPLQHRRRARASRSSWSARWAPSVCCWPSPVCTDWWPTT